MTRYFLVALLAGMIGVAMLAAADDPTEPPVRLKKKRPAAEVPPVEKEEPKDKRPMPEPKEKAGGEPAVPAEPQMDEQEILNRVSRNMRAAEERLANKELGEPTRQVQRDILDDLDKLISTMSQPPSNDGGGGASSSAQSAQQKQKGGQQASSGGRRSQQKQGQGGKGQQQMARQGGQGTPGQQPGQQSNQQANNQSSVGTRPGAGNGGPEEVKKASDVYKDIWGHLPESLRQEMTAYMREDKMAKYKDVIEQYYRTIAEKGRRKE